MGAGKQKLELYLETHVHALGSFLLSGAEITQVTTGTPKAPATQNVGQGKVTVLPK